LMSFSPSHFSVVMSSLRHIPRPSDRDRSILDPSQPTQPTSQPLPSSSSSHPSSSSSAPPPPPPPSHLNGTALNHAPLSNGAPPPHHHHPPPPPPSTIVSPTVLASNPPPPNGQIPNASTSVMQKLSMSNEQTWLLIGPSSIKTGGWWF
jgi:hypothetical protein